MKEQVLLFGCGWVFRNYFYRISKQFDVLGIFDNDSLKWQIEYGGIVVENPLNIKKFKDDIKIIIMTDRYDDIGKQLTSIGYKNYISYKNIKYTDIYDNTLLETTRGSIPLAHVTYYNVGNAGDNMLSDAVRTTFSNIDNFNWDLISVDKKVDNNLIDEINRNRALIIGGGGLFLPDTNKNDISGWQWACSKELMAKINIPIIGFAIGYNYFYGQEVSSLFVDNLKFFLTKANFVGLRNNGSIKVVKKLVGDYGNNIVFQPCPTTLIRKIYKNIPYKVSSKNIAVNFAFDRIDKRLGENKEDVLKSVAKAIKFIQNKGYIINYAIHCDGDIEFVSNLLEEGVDVKVYNLSYYSPREIIEFYNNMEVVIGARGHAQLIPFGLNCRILSLGTHEKMKWFLDDIDSLDCFIDLKNKEDVFERIISCFENIVKDKYMVERLISKQEYLFDITKNNLEKLSAFIKER